MTELPDFAKLVPGFDFLKGLVKQAGSGVPALGQWIAPTVDPEELDKRIEQLKTVQFWLEQNARMIGATVQALEVQRMTLSTLRSMKLPVDQITQAMQVPGLGAGLSGLSGLGAMAGMAGVADPSAAAPAASAHGAGVGEDAVPPAPARAPRKPARPKATAAKVASPGGAGAAPGGADPMQWWGALTQQFGELASRTMKELAREAPGPAAGDAAPAASGKKASKARAAPRKTAARKKPSGRAR